MAMVKLSTEDITNMLNDPAACRAYLEDALEKNTQLRNRIYEMRVVYHDQTMACRELALVDLRRDFPLVAALVESDRITEVSYSNQDGGRYEFRCVYP